MTTKKGMKLRRPHLQLMYVLAPNDELQMPYDVLSYIKQNDCDPHTRRLAVSTFLSLTEAMVEEHSPPFQGGLEWDNRRKGAPK